MCVHAMSRSLTVGTDTILTDQNNRTTQTVSSYELKDADVVFCVCDNIKLRKNKVISRISKVLIKYIIQICIAHERQRHDGFIRCVFLIQGKSHDILCNGTFSAVL